MPGNDVPIVVAMVPASDPLRVIMARVS